MNMPSLLSDIYIYVASVFFFFSSRRRHTRYWRDWSSDVCSSDLITPLTDRRERRRNQPLVALDNLEICGNSICADRGVDEHFALKVRLPRAAGIDRCYTLHQDRGLQSRWANRRWDFRRNNSGRFKTACRQPVAHRTDRRSDAVEN